MIPGNTSSQGKYVDPPTSVTASAGNGQATVSFTVPVYRGKGSVTYTVTASPGGATASGASSPLTVTGLSNGTSYTFAVTALTNYGTSKQSDNSNAATPVAPPPDFPPSFPPSFPPPCNHCPSGGSWDGGGYCYYNCGTGSSSCACGPGSPTGYVSPQGTADCYYGATPC